MDRKAVNDWVNRKMNAKNLSMRRLAREAGFKSHSDISQVLNEKKEAGLDFYIKIAQVFGEDAVPEMMQVAGVLPTEDAIKGSFLELFKLISRMSPEAQQEAESYLNYLIEKEKRQPNKARSDNSDLATDGGASR